MADFEKAVARVFVHEGGFVNDSNDSGGATNMGITRGTLSDWRGVVVTVDDVRDLTRAEAASIYRAGYWDAMRLDQITDQKLANAVMDFGVNAGVRRAVKILQMAVNAEMGVVLTEDGLIGPQTLKHTNAVPPLDLSRRYFEWRVRFYLGLAQRKSQRGFLYAWLKRTLDHL